MCIDLLNGVMSRAQHQLVRPPAAKAAGGNIDDCLPNLTWALFLRNLVHPAPPPKRRGQGIGRLHAQLRLGFVMRRFVTLHGDGFHDNRPLLRANPNASVFF